jgi:hypothetical protein
MAERFTAWLGKPWSLGQAIGYGTLAVGGLDALAAIVTFGLRGMTPYRLFQGIAVGLLGRASFEGGWSTSALGVVLHFCVALGIVTTLVVASRFLPALARRPLLVGPLYGVVAFFVMNLVVIPLSAIGTVVLRWPAAINGLLIHALLVGPPAAIAAAKASAWRSRASGEPGVKRAA